MTAKKTASSIPKARSRKPVEVRLTLSYRFGARPENQVTVMNDRAIPMVDSVFKARDRIARSFVATLMQAASLQPKVLRELLPLLGLRTPAKAAKGKKSA
jgi:hypothetical protein